MRAGLIVIALVGLLLISPVAGQDEIPVITVGTVNGTITDNDPTDRYQFEAIAGQEVTITMEAVAGSGLDANLSLFDGSGDLVETDDDSAGNRNARIVYTPRIDDVFTIEATRYQLNPPLTTGAYQLTLEIAGQTPATIDPLSIPPDFAVPFEEAIFDETLTGAFGTGSDVQYFVVGANQGDFLRVELTTGTSLIANVRILSRIDQTLSVISRTARRSASDQVIFTTIPQTGWYLIEVERDSGIGNFTLTPAVVSDTLLTSETPIQAAFQTDDEPLFFVFNATINERVFVNLTVLSGTGIEPEITIFDLTQTSLTQRSSQGAQVRVNLNVPRSSPYIVQVRNLRSSAGEFELQLRRVPVDIGKLPVREAQYNESYVGTIDSENPISYFRFNGKSGELVTIEMNHLTLGEANLDPYLILADSQLNELIFNDNLGATRDARIAQFALPADGDYYILATRAGLRRGDTSGGFRVTLTVGEIQLESGDLTATVTWQGEADLNLFVRTPVGTTVSWANPDDPFGGQLQIDSNTGCDTPTAQPIEHAYWNEDLQTGDYVVWVWYQANCMMSGPTSFTLTVNYRNETIFTATSTAFTNIALEQGERYEMSLRLTDSGSAVVVNQGMITSPSAQQTESQGGDSLIVYGQTLSGDINDQVFARFYQFTGNKGDTVRVRADRVTSNLDPIVVLRDAFDITLCFNDDISSDDRNSELIYTLPEDGSYVVSVTRFGVRDGTTGGNYNLTLERLSPSDPRTDLAPVCDT